MLKNHSVSSAELMLVMEARRKCREIRRCIRQCNIPRGKAFFYDLFRLASEHKSIFRGKHGLHWSTLDTLSRQLYN